MRGFDPYLTFQKLEVFCTVAELGSVTGAADKLCVTQPVVTAHLRSMEAKLGCVLVKRVGRNIALTEAGHRVHRWALEVLTLTHEMERELAVVESGCRGQATIATFMSLGSYFLPPLISEFTSLHNEGRVTVQVSNTTAAIDTVRAGGCDFAVTFLEPNQDLNRLTTHHLWDEPLVLVCAPETRWLDEKNLLASLSRVAFVSAPLNTIHRKVEDDLLRKRGLENRNIVLELAHPEAIKHAVKNDLGLCFMLYSSVRSEVEQGSLKLLDHPDLHFNMPVFLVHRSDKIFSTYQSVLIQHLLDSTQKP
ncbi:MULTISPECIES: LysR family transcriptional regulator [Pseudomonas]|uniref:LysR family transcriptional regulator n=1 Tax=Pseudomonas tritici TaxID=2745518 RepID=A0A8I0CYV9_9PSED|nr:MULTISPECIES: LysR family transcriptional regulator [Pseudomonas]MBP2870020.1 LysR family transcriptional regulator [Pseudomonas sp. SWRI144]QXH81343.1 LysR family transcriptional regulator [Pseudomonas tritici]